MTATGRTTFGALTLADFEAVVGKAKMWAGSKPKRYISQRGWANSMQRLLDAAGGNTLVSLAMGAEKHFPRLPSCHQPSFAKCIDGHHRNSCLLLWRPEFGSRRGFNVKVDPSFYFSQDALAVRATQRYDINIHDIGDATNAGGIVKLQFG